MKRGLELKRIISVFAVVAFMVLFISCSEPEPQMHTVYFETNGGTWIEYQTVQDGECATKPSDPERIGSTFNGWLYNDSLYDFSSPVVQDLVLTADWTVHSYVVTLDMQTDDVDDMTITAYYGERLNLPAPYRPNYYFAGWYLDFECLTEYDEYNTEYTEPFTLYAKWIGKGVTVEYDANGGELSGDRFVNANYGDFLEKPADPIRKGYIFEGWMYENAEFDFSIPATYNMTLTASWVPKTVNVTFVLNNEENNYSTTVTTGEKLNLPTPKKDGYDFSGWYEDESLSILYDESNSVYDSDLILYAGWKKMIGVSLEFNLPDSVMENELTLMRNGEPFADTVIYMSEGEAIQDPGITLVYDNGTTSVSFLPSWYEDSEHQIPFVFGSPVSDGVVLYASWDILTDDQGTFYVYDSDGLYAWAEAVESSSEKDIGCVLLADITLPEPPQWESNWEPVANGYTGIFEGNNHVISGLKIESTLDYLGLFGMTGYGSEIRNLYMTDVSITGGDYVGTIVAESHGKIINCHVSDVEINAGASVGGICGYGWYQNLISGCTADVLIESKGCAGGICGELYSGNIVGCSSSGNISGKLDVGGILGRTRTDFSSMCVLACYSNATVTTTGEGITRAGGIAGSNAGNLISNYFTGSLSPDSGNGYDAGMICASNTEVIRYGYYSESIYPGVDYNADYYGAVAENVQVVNDEYPWERVKVLLNEGIDAWNDTAADGLKIDYYFEINDVQDESVPLILIHV